LFSSRFQVSPSPRPKLAHEVVGQAMDRIPEGRQYELQIEVTRSLRRLANRVDDGYSIEVRSFVPPDEEDEHTEAWDDVAEEEIEAAQAITERQPRMRRMNLNGRPILELPEGDDSEEAAGEDDAEPS
jgi:hypothetical protein